MSDQTKEQVYDEKIAPLMTQVLNLCKRHEIPMIASFNAPSEDDPNLIITSFLLFPEWNTPDEFKEAAEVIRPQKPLFAAFTVSTK